MAQKLSKDQKRKKKLTAKVKKNNSTLLRPHLWPLYKCFASEQWLETRNNHNYCNIMIVRGHKGRYQIAMYMVDLLCQGVKDCFMSPEFSEHAIDDEITRCLDTSRGGDVKAPCNYKLALNIIRTSILWAEKFEIKPNPGFQKVKRLLPPQLLEKQGDDEDIHCGDNEGKPYWMASPNFPGPSPRQTELIEAADGHIDHISDQLSALSEFFGD